MPDSFPKTGHFNVLQMLRYVEIIGAKMFGVFSFFKVLVIKKGWKGQDLVNILEVPEMI